MIHLVAFMQRRFLARRAVEFIARSSPGFGAACVVLGFWACSPEQGENADQLPSEGVGGGGSSGSAEGGDAGRGGGAGDPVAVGGASSRGDAGDGELGVGNAPGLVDAAASPGWDAGVDHGSDAAAPTGSEDAGRDAGGHAGYVDSGPALDPALARRLSAFSSRLAVLADRTSTFWFEHGPDPTFGGFHGTLDRNGNPTSPDDKGLIQETRHLWSLSTWYERRGADPELAALAASTYAFIRDNFVDTDGGFVFKVSRDGSRVVDSKKQLFAESYAIYALSTYGRVFNVPAATGLALARFESIDASRHDATFGGYDQRGDPGFLTAGAEKDTNTHLHLLEAFTA